MTWYDFICMDKVSAKILAIKPFSGISVGKEYCCWEECDKYYRLWNSCDRDVKVPKCIFKVITYGDALKAP